MVRDRKEFRTSQECLVRAKVLVGVTVRLPLAALGTTEEHVCRKDEEVWMCEGGTLPR